MPADKETQRQIRSIQTATSRSGPLTSAEEAVFDRLLTRKAEALPDALARRARETAERERIEKRRAKMVAREQKLASELRNLQLDIDRCTDELSGHLHSTARRDVVGRLEAFYDLTAKFIEGGMPPPSRAAVRAFAELVATPYLRERREPPLRQRLAIEEPKKAGGIGLSAEEMDDGERSALALKIIEAGRRRRGELP